VGLGAAESFLFENRPLEKDAMGAIATQDLSRPPVVGSRKACLEVPVTVRGGSLSTDSGKREPFSESTRTIIVFSDGAVLRLKTAVNPGQLIFLTNEHTGKQVLGQVVKSKTYQNVAGYIELQFTQPTVGFWGIIFPGDGPESRSAPGAAGVSQAPSGPQPLPSVASHTTPPVASTHSSAAGSINRGLLSPKRGTEWHAALGFVSSPLAEPAHAGLIQPKVVPVSHAEEHASIAEPVVFSRGREAATPAPPATRPREDAEIAAFINRLMFEKPETEFAHAAPHHSPVIPLIVAGLLLAALAGGGWLLWRHRAHETVANLSPRSANVIAVMSAPSPTNPSVSAEQPAESLATPNTASERPAAISHFRLLRPHAKRALSSAKNREVAGIDSVPALPPPVSLQGPGTLVGVSGSQPAAPEAARPTLNEVKTARLISSVPPVYPPLALSLRVEGDVTLDALIEESGHITTIKVLSGPTVLKQAAVAAVRQWKYKPATLNGSPTPIHLSVTVKFHLP
jgi:periplasmic protein TonB